MIGFEPRQPHAYKLSWKCLTLLAALLGTLASSTTTYACNVPVFRFALERWPAGAYELVVFHKGPLTVEQRDALRLLTTAATHGQRPAANVAVEKPVDLSGSVGAALRKLSNTLKLKDLPLVVVRFPAATRLDEPFWAAPLNRDNAAKVLQSPARKELVDRLLGGQAAVWVLLESGDRTRDEAAAQLLQDHLRHLEKTLKLPALTDSPEDRLANTSLPLQLKFSMLRLARSNPAEAVLIQMLLHTEEDLATYQVPMIFPVYGRGRALYALVGKGITRENITEAATFLAGPCTCTIKDQNPGIDLLLAADWDRFLVPLVKERPRPPLVGPSSVLPAVEDLDEEETPNIQPVNLEKPPSQWQQSLANFKKVPRLNPGDEAEARGAKRPGNGQASTGPGASAPQGAELDAKNSGDSDASDAASPGSKGSKPVARRSSGDSALLWNTLISVGVGLVIVAAVYFFVRSRSVPRS